MDAIILAGGKGTRMMPLTIATPKPLLQVQGHAILEWSLLSLPKTVDHVIVVVNYLQEQIADYMQHQTVLSDYELVQQQPKPLGTGHAVQCCQPHLRSHKFIVINGDDLYDAISLEQLAQQPLAILAATRDEAFKFGVLAITDDNKLKQIREKPSPHLYVSPALVNAGAYKFDDRIFDYQLPLSSRGEFEITDYVTYLTSITDVNVVPAAFWFPLGTPDDFTQAQSLDLDTLIRLKSK